MQIANPIYDVVFKYLLNDSKIAKLLLSKIIGEEIVELSMSPQESVVELERHSLTVFRIDFGATIKTESGPKKVIIEIQKAKFASDIMRFRKYLGQQYQDGNNVYLDGQGRKQALPILTIYFLGYALERIEAAVIRVKRLYEDGATSTPIEERNDFIESLSHDSYVIQIPHLKKKRMSELELILSIFDQSKVTGGGGAFPGHRRSSLSQKVPGGHPQAPARHGRTAAQSDDGDRRRDPRRLAGQRAHHRRA